MSIQVLTLEQVCTEHPRWPTPLEAETRQFLNGTSTPQTVKSRPTLHDVLRHLVTTLTLPLPLDQILQTLSTLIMQAMDVDLCVILLGDREQSHFRVHTWTPDLSQKGVQVQAVAIDPWQLEQLRNACNNGTLPYVSFHHLEALNPLKNVQFETLLPVPLYAGSECIGLLNCYASRITKYSDEELLMLSTIAAQTALAIKYRQYIDEEANTQKKLVQTFVSALCSDAAENKDALRRQARIVGYDLTKPHSVVLFDLAKAEKPLDHSLSTEHRQLRQKGVIKQIKQCIETRYPGSLLDERDNVLVCLLNLDQERADDQLSADVEELMQQCNEQQLVAGIGNCCQTEGDYRRGYAEASEALEVGQVLHQKGRCTHFNALGAYRYIYKFAHTDTLYDQYQKQIDQVVEYDRRKRANLLDTLEIYLECGGNVARASIQLDVHRNTLLQRLERLQKLCDLVDLEQWEHRLPLLLALKIYKLRVCESYLS